MYGEGDLDNGSFASHAIWRESYLFKIPAAISNESAAPLMCGGSTVFNALEMHGVRPTDHVGVVGVGGLGHLAIEFASAMGCEVSVFSNTDSKREEAMRLGANKFYATKGLKHLEIDEPVNYLLVTTSEQPDWDMYFKILAPGSAIFPLTVSGHNLSLPYMPFILSGFKVQGCIVGSRAINHKMLDFVALHNIKPIIEKFQLDKSGVEEAFEHLEQGKMRYRGVLVAP